MKCVARFCNILSLCYELWGVWLHWNCILWCEKRCLRMFYFQFVSVRLLNNIVKNEAVIKHPVQHKIFSKILLKAYSISLTNIYLLLLKPNGFLINLTFLVFIMWWSIIGRTALSTRRRLVKKAVRSENLLETRCSYPKPTRGVNSHTNQLLSAIKTCKFSTPSCPSPVHTSHHTSTLEEEAAAEHPSDDTSANIMRALLMPCIFSQRHPCPPLNTFSKIIPLMTILCA